MNDERTTAQEALSEYGLDWTVKREPIAVESTGDRINTHVANVREDTGVVLGIVGKGTVTIQNAELAHLAQSIVSDDGRFWVQNAGSICGGQRVFLNIGSEGFRVNTTRGTDTVQPYLMVANGFKGDFSLAVLFNSLRVSCMNQLPQIWASVARGNTLGFRFRHTANIDLRIKEAKQRISQFWTLQDAFKNRTNTLAQREFTRTEMQEFFLGVYQELVAPIPVAPSTPKETRQRDRATKIIANWSERHDIEAAEFGSSAWIGVNACTRWFQQERNVRGDNIQKADRRLSSKLFGQSGQESGRIAAKALALV